MKVVLFCGGQGMRIREIADAIPKPMVHIGYRPILWHVMKYYAHFGHKDFILCLGYKADIIKNYFLNYDECISNDFVLSEGGKKLDLLTSDIHDWTITFVDTGYEACIGERLKAVKPYLEAEEAFLANYADCVTDLYLPDMINHFRRHAKVACFLGVQPNYTFHIVDAHTDGTVRSLTHVERSGIRINGGFFIFKKEIFDYMEKGEDLVEAPFSRLAQARQLVTYNYDGFWACMDTFKEKRLLEDIYMRGDAPWKVWNDDVHQMVPDAGLPRHTVLRRTSSQGDGAHSPETPSTTSATTAARRLQH